MRESLKRKDAAFRLREAFYRAVPFLGAGAVSTAVAYGFIEGNSGGIILPVIIFLTLGIITLAFPLEIILLSCLACVLLADSYYVPGVSDFYYVRFLPLGMLAVRSLMALAIRGVQTEMLPGIVLKPFGILFVLAVFSTLHDHINPLLSFLRAMSMGLMLAGLGVGIPAWITDLRRLRRGVHILIVLLAGFIIPGFVTSPFNPRANLQFEEYARLKGFFNNPNTLGLMAMLTLFPLIGWWSEASRRIRVILTPILVLIILSLFYSGSRASLVGTLAAAVAFFSFIRIDYRTKALVIILCVTILGVYLALPALKPIIIRPDYGLRPELWKRAVELGMQSPWLGIGFGSTDQFFQMDRPYLESIGVASQGSHSEYLRIFVALGAPALGLIIFGFIMILVKAGRFVYRLENNVLPLSLMCAVIGGVVNAIFEDWIFSFGGAPTIPFWCFVVILAMIMKKHVKKHELEKRSLVEKNAET